MTRREIRIAIAEELGHQHVAGRFIGDTMSIGKWEICSGICGEGGYVVPDYPNDLNACAEMEKALNTSALRGSYHRRLTEIADGDSQADQLCHATARQRCEAFLRVRGKWREYK